MDFHCDEDGIVSGAVIPEQDDNNDKICQDFPDLDIGYECGKTLFEVNFFQKDTDIIHVEFKRTYGCTFMFNDFFNQFMTNNMSLSSCTWPLRYTWES